jgi:hypothetical protein
MQRSFFGAFNAAKVFGLDWFTIDANTAVEQVTRLRGKIDFFMIDLINDFKHRR